MSLPRMQPKDGVAWITGASSGIGEAVALELAERGWTVAITARRLDLLEVIADSAADLPGRIVAHAGDVTDAAAMRALVEGIESVHGPIALAFLNAGIAPKSKTEPLDLAALEAAVDINLLGAARGLAAVLERMKQRGRGHIVVNASVAGYGGLPGAVAYGTSKAGAIYLCESLKPGCEKFGIRVQVLNLGFIDTPMTQKHEYLMPFLMPVEEAARRAVDGFERGGFEIAVPRRMAWGLKLLNLLPYPLYFRAVTRLSRRGG
ncbi:SDR family NAD(P)-dependent oxidoreductase [Bosea caraganae]|uniref:SDR family NAD(P)-dependent oxidoreductase n=1 Tax=Bosea caraganae TaxID=2763117 RepID=A0A370L181_9HYPH|nr:SDR family NAD(P)-dependent oxidoreductase [Bosea caraganae]RDJ21268.1 SDR family NAD(P)-dependent oxidoreductase [Bosea caraganae]RDJ26408.1 SDR family NAD(P)-dependent oxidoreductase [Bosea caraganae]